MKKSFIFLSLLALALNIFAQSTYTYGEVGNYIGVTQNGRRDGWGMERYANGDAHIGQFTNNVYNGFAIHTWKNGSFYVGYYKNAKKDGRGVLYEVETGTVYICDWRNDVAAGGDVYKRQPNGPLKNIQSFPKSTFAQQYRKSPNLTFVEVMQAVNDLCYDFFDNNDINLESGSYKIPDEKFHAIGYEGGMFNGQKEGYGTQYYYSKNDSVFLQHKGTFINDSVYGFGCRTTKRASVSTGIFLGAVNIGLIRLPYGDIYAGYQNMRNKEGYGIYIWTSGDTYVGDWVYNRPYGHGTFVWASGRKYEGEYVNGKREGYGTMYFKDGTVQRGYWKDDEFQGEKK